MAWYQQRDLSFLIVRVRFPEIDNVDPVSFLPPTAYRDYRRNKRQEHVSPCALSYGNFSLTWEHIRKWWPRGPVLQDQFVISFCGIVYYLPLIFYILLAPPPQYCQKFSNNFSGQYTVEKRFEEPQDKFSWEWECFWFYFEILGGKLRNSDSDIIESIMQYYSNWIYVNTVQNSCIF